MGDCMKLPERIILALIISTTVIATLAPVAGATSLRFDLDQGTAQVLKKLDTSFSAGKLETKVLQNNVNINANARNKAALKLNILQTPITVPTKIAEPVSVGAGKEKIEITRPFASQASPATAVSSGVVSNENNNETKTVTAVKNDASVQMATVIDSSTAPERFSYQLSLPPGAKITQQQGLVFIKSSTGDLIGGFTPPWAKDANGKNVPTRYEVAGTTLTQVVDHQTAQGVSYPVLADPLYARGMIAGVSWERWASGGWEVRLQVTALARTTWLINPALVYTEGLKDLREHFPRSMASATMAQQWECHVAGLPGTINIDLESYRRSWPGWRAGIAAALIKGNPAKACNW